MLRPVRVHHLVFIFDKGILHEIGRDLSMEVGNVAESDGLFDW